MFLDSIFQKKNIGKGYSFGSYSYLHFSAERFAVKALAFGAGSTIVWYGAYLYYLSKSC